ncbi:MAG TPA: ATP-binding protein [Longimicrobiaceae bacterium]|nr:ATP-binding protein [Longimicrobiaceae bacterium]
MSIATTPTPAGSEPPPRRRASDRPEENGVRRIVERLADGVVVVDGEGVIRFANPAAEALFGRPAEELAGSPFGFAVTDGRAEIDVLRRGNGVVSAELRAVDVDWEGQPMRLVSLRDVTDRKRAEEHERQLARERAARAEAEAASQAKSDFLAMMSHELRTPLNAVLGYSELLELGLAGPMSEVQREHLERIQSSGRHLLGLVNEVLDLARVEAGQLTVRPMAAAADDAVAAALALARPLAAARGLAITAERDGDDAAPVVYLGDEGRVRQILVNLLSNAVKFTGAEGAIRVEWSLCDAPDAAAKVDGPSPWVCFRVHDTGIGIEPDKLDAIFDPFVQVEAGHTRSHDGSGLGLTISRRLARLMGGDLVAESTPGRGSTFTLWLPAASAASAPVAAPSVEGEVPAQNVAGLADAGRALMRCTEHIVEELVCRLRADPPVPAAPRLPYSQLADHAGCMLADFALSCIALQETQGQPSPSTADSGEIQRLVADRHGAQRGRLGWDEAGLRAEFAMLREEVERALRRGLAQSPPEELANALAVIAGLLTQAEHVSMRALQAVRTG